MPGTQAGWLKAKATMIKKYGSEEAYRDFCKEVGRKGGLASNNGGFASWKVGNDGLTGRQRARVAGSLGGKVGRKNAPMVTSQWSSLNEALHHTN